MIQASVELPESAVLDRDPVFNIGKRFERFILHAVKVLRIRLRDGERSDLYFPGGRLYENP